MRHIAWLITKATLLLHFSLKWFVSEKKLKEWKPIHLCWWFDKYGFETPEYFIGTHVSAPTVSTSAATNITATSVTGNGSIDATGDENASERGFAYFEGTSGDPDTGDSTVFDTGSFGTGSFSKSIPGLSAGTSYRVRAYAINSGGTGFGTTVDVTTTAAVTETHSQQVKAQITRNNSTQSQQAKASLGNKIYTRGDTDSLPTTDANLETAYTSDEVSNIDTDDGTRVDMDGSGVMLHQFKVKHSNNTDQITGTWNGQSNVAPSANIVTLQIYNRNTSSWETLDSDSATAANTDFTLEGSITTNLSNYYDSNNWVSFRVYQS